MNKKTFQSIIRRLGACCLILTSFLTTYGMQFAFGKNVVRAYPDTLKELEAQARPDYDATALDEIAREKSKVDASKSGFFANPKLVALFAAYEIDVTDGDRRVTIPFRLHAPETIQEGKRYPLIVVWHGQGESDDDNKSQLSHLQYGIRSFYEPSALEAFILAPQCPRNAHGWSSPENRYELVPLEYSVAILRALEERLPIDPKRVSALGICSGAGAALAAEQRYPGLFCAFALCSYPANEYETSEVKAPVWMFGSVEDKSAPIVELRRIVAHLRRRWVRTLLSECSSGHDSWTNALRNEQVIAWLGRQTGKLTAPPPGATLFADRTTREIVCQYVAPLAVLILLFVFVEPRVRRRFRAETE